MERKKTIIIAVVFVVIAVVTAYKHSSAGSGFAMDREGNITDVDVERFKGEMIVPSEIDGVTVKTVSLDGVKGIKIIELDQAKGLESIKIRNMDIDSLDTSKNKSLKQLWIKKTNIKDLNLRSNDKLQSLGCSENKLENLDLSGNPELTYVDCTDNRIKVLDTSKNPLLKTVYVDPDVEVQGKESAVQYFDTEQVSDVK